MSEPITKRLGVAGVLLAIAAILTWHSPATCSPGAPAALRAQPVKPTVPTTPIAFHLAAPGYRWSFPRDMGSHPAYQTEWWYYTGHLKGRRGERFGYELTIFREGLDPVHRRRPSAWAASDLYFAHFAITDLVAHRFKYDERAERGALGLAGAATDRENSWCERWFVREESGVQHLFAEQPGYRIDLNARSLKPPALNGNHGYSQKGTGNGHASEYYSLTRLLTRGTLWKDGRPFAVTGESWMDHEFSTGSLAPDEVGWDWYSIQLDSGEELMLYRMRRRDGTADRHSGGSWVMKDGRTRALKLSDYTINEQSRWTSPHTKIAYPSRWRVRVPSQSLDVEIAPSLPDQELNTAKSTGVTYWEGAASVIGILRGRAVAGEAYVELTGYGGTLSGRA